MNLDWPAIWNGACARHHAAIGLRFGAAAFIAFSMAYSISADAVAETSQTQWPGWRGPTGQGISEQSPPVEWSDAQNIRWTASVPGDGISSPIVVDDKVIVTTSYEGVERTATRQAVAIGLSAAAALLAVAATTSCFKSRRRPAPAEPSRKWGRRLDAAVIGIATLAFVGMALSAVWTPETLQIRPGDFGPAWLVTGIIAQLGLAAAIGWRPRDSWQRPLGAAALLVFAAWLYTNAPHGRYGGPMPNWQRVVMAGTGAAAAFYYLVAFAIGRLGSAGIEPNQAPANRTADWNAALVAVTLTAMAGILFASANYWQPRVGRLRAVVAYDLDTGNELWNTPAFVAPEERKYTANSYATPTPCSDGERIFAYFGSGYACFDLEGRMLWGRPDEDYRHMTKYGAGVSPIVTDDAFLYVRMRERSSVADAKAPEEDSPTTITALGKRTGETLWQTELDFAADSYATPLLWNREGRQELIFATWQKLVGLDPQTGDVFWNVDTPIQMIVPTPVGEGNRLYIVGGAEQGPRLLIAFELSGTGSQTQVRELWQSGRAIPKCVSPLLYRDLLVVLSDQGVMTCVDPETGKRYWNQRVSGNHFASPVAADGRIYAINDEGATTVLSATSKREKPLARNDLGDLGEGAYASPAVADDSLILRTAGRLIAIGLARSEQP